MATAICTRSTVDGRSTERPAGILGRYANHSCRPNAQVHRIGHKVFLRAIKNINPGEEITYSYGRDYFLNVITPRGCKCEKCRAKRSAARAKARAEEPARQKSIRQAVMTVARCEAGGRKDGQSGCAYESSFRRSGHRFAAASASNAKHARAVLIHDLETARAGKSGNCSSGKTRRRHIGFTSRCLRSSNENPPRISPGGPKSSAPSQPPVHPRSAALSRATPVI